MTVRPDATTTPAAICVHDDRWLSPESFRLAPGAAEEKGLAPGLSS